MELLDFARGPALTFAMAVFVLGTLWRLAGVLLLPRMRDLSPPREGAPPRLAGALRTVLRRMWPRPEFVQSTLFMTINSYVFHLGLAVVVFGLAPHILFIRDLLGLGKTDPIPPATIEAVKMGTTVATNALIQRRGAAVALVTTAGFRDLLEIGRQTRPKMYDLKADCISLYRCGTQVF